MRNHSNVVLVFLLTMLALYANTHLVLSLSGMDSVALVAGFEIHDIILFILLVASLGALSTFLFAVFIARFMIGVTVINTPTTYLEKWLFSSVQKQSNQLGIQMPQVGVFYASELNAFTTGWRQKNAMFAVSSGLLESLDQEELEAVIGHELAHIEKGDMISLSLAQGILKTITFLPARLLGTVFDRWLFRSSKDGFVFHAVYWVCMITMGLLPHFVVMWFSRNREFSADRSSALINGTDKMIAALQSLSRNRHHAYLYGQSPALGIAGGILEGLVGGMSNIRVMFSSHPPLNKRIYAIKKLIPDKDNDRQ